MTREEVQKLLGGYATGTLTPAEQQALFEAALDDQEIFDALAREQPLHDLLRDPAARAEVLAALDDRRSAGIWAWVRRPWVAGLAMASVAAIAVAVWQVSRRPAEKAVIVAENRPAQVPEAAQPSPAAAPTPAAPAEKTARSFADKTLMHARRQEPRVPGVSEPVTPSRDAALQPKQQVAITAAAPEAASAKPADELKLNQQAAAPPALPAPQFNQNQAAAAGAQQNLRALDARALFYAPQAPPAGRSAFAPAQADQASGVGGVGGAQLARKKGGVIGGAVGGVLGASTSLGVRASIVRANQELDPSTPLQAGESVKLKLIPNADGFLYVAEGDNLLAGAAVKRLEAFETPELTRDAPGQRQLRITFTRVAMPADALARLAKDTRANLVQTKAETEPATYTVQNAFAPAPQQVVVPITLTWQ